MSLARQAIEEVNPDLARQAIEEVNPELTEQFLAVVAFSQKYPGLAVTRPKRKRKSKKTVEEIAEETAKPLTLDDYLYLAEKFSKGHQEKELLQPKTIPDPALGIIMEHGYGQDPEKLSELIKGHRIAMVAENMIGDLLERYLNDVLDDTWIWCAGEVVKHVDFIQKTSDDSWKALQIKNRDNSENSSSKKVREDTDILKWHRTKSRTGDTNWDNSPFGSGGDERPSEKGFQEYVENYLKEKKNTKKDTNQSEDGGQDNNEG